MDNDTDNQVTINEQAKEKSDYENKIRSTKLYTNSVYLASDAINTLHGRGKILDPITVTASLVDSCKRIRNGNINEIEQMLMMQAKTLDYVFYDSLTRLVDHDQINQIECIANVALRAQNQSRKTLAVLAELKNPRRTTFIKQQNNAVTQQVNNAVKSESERIGKNKKVANELIAEITHEHKKMDIGTTITTGAENTESATVGALHRPKNRERKRHQQTERL